MIGGLTAHLDPGMTLFGGNRAQVRSGLRAPMRTSEGS
jgi:hypothetical protein